MSRPYLSRWHYFGSLAATSALTGFIVEKLFMPPFWVAIVQGGFLGILWAILFNIKKRKPEAAREL